MNLVQYHIINGVSEVCPRPVICHMSLPYCSFSIFPLSMAGDLSSSETPHTRKISLKKGKNVPAQGASSASPWHLQRALTLCGTGESYRRATTIHILSDDVLLGIFDSYRKVWNCDITWPWHLLLHVCRRWRQVIFTSPHHLKLQLLCTIGTPVRKNLGIWPPFPVHVDYYPYYGSHLSPHDEDNAIAALVHHNRVCHVELKLTSPQLGRMVTAMQEPYPVLRYLSISSKDGSVPALPTEFLGGCAPCLQEVRLSGIAYPALPSLLLSATHLVTLRLIHIPPTGFISLEALVLGLAAVPRLERFTLDFQSITPSLNRTPPPLAARIDLPFLTAFVFQGTGEYLENLVAQIDSPQLVQILITYLDQPNSFQIYQLPKFISRSGGCHLASKHAEVSIYKDMQLTTFDMSRSPYHDPCMNSAGMRLGVSCASFVRLSPLAQVLSQFSASLSRVVHLKLTIKHVPRPSTSHHGWLLYNTWTGDVEWQPLLRQFIAVETLRVSWDLAERIASALEYSVSEETEAADALPSLHLIYLEGQPESSIEKFVTARQLSGRPVSFFKSEYEFNRRLESYGSEEWRRPQTQEYIT